MLRSSGALAVWHGPDELALTDADEDAGAVRIGRRGAAGRVRGRHIAEPSG